MQSLRNKDVLTHIRNILRKNYPNIKFNIEIKTIMSNPLMFNYVRKSCEPQDVYLDIKYNNCNVLEGDIDVFLKAIIIPHSYRSRTNRTSTIIIDDILYKHEVENWLITNEYESLDDGK